MFSNEKDSTSTKIFSSNSAINSILYGGAKLVLPIAVPLICFKVFLPKVKTLFFSTASVSSTSVEVLTYLSLIPISFVEQTDPCHVEY